MSAAAEAHGHGHAGHPPAPHYSSRVSPATLGILLFIGSEIMLFGSFFTAYFFVRVVNGIPWPQPPFELPKFVAGVNTAILAFMTIRAFRGHFTAEHHHGVEIGGIYWHFVDVMWIIVYVTVYLL